MTASAEEIMRLTTLRQVEQERAVAVQNAQAIYKALLVALGGDDGDSG